MDYLIHYRIEQAKRLLTETDEPGTNIAFMTGFHSSAYFGKIFKKYLNVTPKEFRQARKMDMKIRTPSESDTAYPNHG